MDVVAFNRYYAWYENAGLPATISTDLGAEIEEWYDKHKKPLMITEYGAGAIAGIHKVCT